MPDFKLIVLNVCDKIRKIILVVITCLIIIGMLMAPKAKSKKIFLPEEEALINLTLDHNQCLSYGHMPDSFEYFNCMKSLEKQRKSTVSI
ncbi:MAG: hypothetical protein HRU36_03780 [Rickettsiales bacterium]|nr:hypothetical protein [Rickettsiales bacterium]